MRKEWKTCLMSVPVAFVLGCGEGKRPRPAVRVPVESASTSSVPDEVALSVAEIERDLSTLPSVVTNWPVARAAARRISDKIVKLPPPLSEQYGRRMAKEILSVPIDHLSYHARFRTIVTIFYMLTEEVGWRAMNVANLWELRTMSLMHCRDAIECARSEEMDRRNRDYLAYISNTLNWHSEIWEKELAYRVSQSISPRDRAWMVKEVPEEEYLAIRKRFEEFLGRPIRSYEEIRRIQDERIEAAKRARESRPTDSDVKVDVDL